MDFEDLEAVEGLRFSWNAWPTIRLEASRCAVPFGAICQPIQKIPDLPRLKHGPLRCSACGAVLNPFCPVQFESLVWVCCICQSSNKFPKTHSAVSETNLPVELFPTHNVVEYSLSQTEGKRSPCIVFVVDTACPSEDLVHIRQALKKAAAAIPDGVRVGLVSFGSMIRAHLLRPGVAVPSSVLLPGDKAVASDKVGLQVLISEYSRVLSGRTGVLFQGASSQGKGGLSGLMEQGAKESGGALGMTGAMSHQWGEEDLLVPAEKCRESFPLALAGLGPELEPTQRNLRPKRVTGAALAAAVALLDAAGAPRSPGRVVSVLSGPCTAGPGLVVSRDYSDQLRSHHDLHSDKTLYFRGATSYYTLVGELLGARGVALDAFACSPDQVGLAELRPAVEATGGVMLLADSPDSDSFSTSLAKLFRTNDKGQLDTCFDATMEVRTAEGVRVAGALGPCASLRRKGGMGPCAWTSETGNEAGQSGTWAWRMPCLTHTTSLALLFEICSLSPGDICPDSTFFVQICTAYTDSSGCRALRACTVGRRWKHLGEVAPASLGSGSGLSLRTPRGLGMEMGYEEEGRREQEDTTAALFDVITGFDQEAAAALVAKVAVGKMETQDPEAVLRWLDRMLVRFGAKFGRYTPDMPPSFLLGSNLFLFPSFVYHLRRSPFLQIFNCSPDDSAFRRVALLREGVLNCLLMVQPTLVSYTLSSPPQFVPLDLTVVKADNILLYDSFFEIVVHHGSTITQWRRAGYQDDDSHKNFRKLLEEPLEAAKGAATERWLEPRLISCEQNDSMSRFLTYRLSPAAVQLSTNQDSRMTYISTDDVSLQNFISHFHNLAVKS